MVNPRKIKSDTKWILECRKDKKKASKTIQLKLIPTMVHLPVVPNPSKRIVKSITKGSHLLLTWMVVKTGTKAVWLPPPNWEVPHVIKLIKYDFRTGLVNATLLLMNLTWIEDAVTKGEDVNITVAIGVCNDRNNASCTLRTWTAISVDDSPVVLYPKGPIRISPSPMARVAQPTNAKNLTSLSFSSALPLLMESPYRVTERAGIVYLLHWDSPALVHIPGVLVEWSLNNSGVGLAWLPVSVEHTNCSRSLRDQPLWEVCSESVNERQCTATCGQAATPKGQGFCQWREGMQTTRLSRNYSTCSTELLYCPDRWCDPLEELNPRICSQDCTKGVVLGTLDNGTGIASGIGVCTCDIMWMCHCGPNDKQKGPNPNVPRNQPRQSPKPPLQQGPEICDFQCFMVLGIVGLSVVSVLGVSVYIIAYRGCNFRKKGRESNREYSVHALLPIPGPEARTPVEPISSNQYETDPKWEIPRGRLMVEECLGEGEFGRVLKATARDLPGSPGFTTVAVKTLKDNAGSSELDDLMSEYQLLKEVSHPNVIKLLGACTASGGPMYIIIEFCGLGSLRAYLRRHRNINTNSEAINTIHKVNDISPRDILSFAWQISKGMAYLTEIKLVHRDLAARNILLATGKVCKISDFGLTRDVYEDDTYLKKSRGRVPVKWMAPESLSDHIYTSKSDVWSFGIVLWELVTLGSSPYPGIAVQNLYHLLKSGYRMQRPHNCSEQLYEIMNECWSGSPSERPSFAYLVDKFERMLEDGSDYLDCNIKMVSNPAYFASNEDQGIDGNEMDIRFTMDLQNTCENENRSKYENELVNKNTSYDIPKPISCIVMSDLLMKDEQRK
ncbi:proto-oncogene tyrosine-protein kinase receptor Ret [Halyomorpha halys]|uniref:proto-oncogene tyrosine-protein kinase receptor Ret n=1 Tax=Halyomorpha halys TaxID=286706 RepID=UPI0006D4D0FB|nr:proto-oncogene tyrosine-protein kinase receptor Ret isoform X2 [Halyomorpha halys]